MYNINLFWISQKNGKEMKKIGQKVIIKFHSADSEEISFDPNSIQA